MTSIFRKQFFLYTGALVVSFSLLGIGLVQAFTSFFYTQQKLRLESQAEIISNTYISTIGDENTEGTEDDVDKMSEFKKELKILCKYLDQSVLVVNYEGEICYSSGEISLDLSEKDIVIDDLSRVLEGKNKEYKHNFGGIYSGDVFFIGYPIIDSEGNRFGAIFLGGYITQINATLLESYRIIAIFIGFAILIGFVLVYISSKAISQPLMEMNEAAKVIANGDFEKRMRINSNDEVGQLADSFNEMASSLFQQEKRRREFISNISHDLRSPLTSMRGFLQAMIDGTIPMEKQAHYLQIVLDETERLSKMANTILDINKLEENENSLALSDFDINELALKTAFNFEDRIVQGHIKLKTIFDKEVLMVNADYDKIQRVIYNLLDNAVKFTHKYGNIVIQTEVKDNKVYVHIKDNGKGVSKEEQKRVFDRLYKADYSRGKDKKGSGLGLSIVKAFIKAHGETITLNSDIGKGCEFIFTLKLSDKKKAD